MTAKKKIPSFFDEDLKLRKIDGLGDPLAELDKSIDWEQFRYLVEKPFAKTDPKRGGRPHYDRIMMFKLLILQRIYDLSDDAMEFQINDRLSFMRFLGLTISDRVPDAKTIWHFREKLTNSGVIDKLFIKYTMILKEKELIVKKGAIIDASIIETKIQHNNKDENDEIKKDRQPQNWDENKSRQKDLDARWTKKHNRNFFGFKNHIVIDAKSKLIEDFQVTPANITDTEVGGELIDALSDETEAVYADRAYASTENFNKLSRRKIANRIMRKKQRGQKLSNDLKKFNKSISKVRCRVEHVFGLIKQNGTKFLIRSIGLRRATAQITLMNIAYNMRRSLKLAKA